MPSLTALVEFEAVARLGSFTQAASELGVTQAAVSRQVRFLEETLGVRLFHRLHRSIALTSEGEALYVVVAESMQKIAGVFDRLSIGAEQQELVLGSTAPFAQLRLLPRLPNLKKLDPPLQLRLTTQMFTADLRHVEVDMAVRYGDGSWGDGTSALLFDEEVFPVCSPGFLEEYGMPGTLEALAAGDVSGVLGAATDAVAGIADAAGDLLAGIVGADPAGGVATLVEMVAAADHYDLTHVTAPVIAEVASIVDTLSLEVVPLIGELHAPLADSDDGHLGLLGL